MTQGTVKWFNPIKGIGFLSVDGGERDVFVHFSAIEAGDARSLGKNRRVEFDIIQGERTRQAAHVRISDHESISRTSGGRIVASVTTRAEPDLTQATASPSSVAIAS